MARALTTKRGLPKRMANCHPDKLHYGKGLCKNCYRKTRKAFWKTLSKSYFAQKIRERRQRAMSGNGPPVCKHKDRKHHKAGYCEECYNERQDQKRGQYNSEQGLKHYLRKTYGITSERYEEIANQQGGLCAICSKQCSTSVNSGKEKRFHVDHDHETGKIRGLLCNHCNRGLGCFMDNPELLLHAYRYLDHHKKC